MMKRATIETLLTKAQELQSAVEQHVGAENAASHPQWKNANAKRRQLVRRLASVTAKEELEAELVARRGSDE
ncbi:MAG: hypothetical protein H6824_06000 [Planctomycetaceae bacterium]|nr:hypothetical protein [Planctomycetaceae bacterium]